MLVKEKIGSILKDKHLVSKFNDFFLDLALKFIVSKLNRIIPSEVIDGVTNLLPSITDEDQETKRTKIRLEAREIWDKQQTSVPDDLKDISIAIIIAYINI